MTASGEPVGASEPAMADGEATPNGSEPDMAPNLDDVPAQPIAPDPGDVVSPPRQRGIRGSVRRFSAPLARVPHPPLHSRRGWFIVLLLIAGFGSAMTVTAVAAVSWTETADFCGRCHTMGPELKAYSLSPHRDVACAECHVEPGVAGWIKAKINGTRQLLLVLTGAYPKPIVAPDHADLPPTSRTCVRCHETGSLVANGGPVKLVLQERYHPDEPNTKDTVALVVRPAGFGGTEEKRGVHWHIAEDVDYLSPDPRAQTIDYVAVTAPGGGTREFLASSAVSLSTDVQPDIDRLKASGPVRRMDCIDCHNRVGHGVSTPDQAIDDSMAARRIDAELPFIKREASDRLSIEYASIADADRAIEGLRTFYGSRYPLVATALGPKVNAAIDDLKRIYRLVATPEMQVTGTTYPNNLGHQSAPGCFRCHDGAHYKVKNGALTQESIPSSCATCHTFPQIGATASGVLIGERPQTHDDRLWVFDHKTSAISLDPSGTSCGTCHTRTYCENCHDTKAVKVPHDDMVYNHAAVMQKTGAPACAYCHQPAYCAQCHAGEVLPDPFPPSGGTSPISP
jgi:hypothetical protein